MKKIFSSILLLISTYSFADTQVEATVLSSYKLPDVCEKSGNFANTALGAVAGAAIGSQFGDGSGKDILTVTGAVVGANIANSENYECYSKGFSTTIQFYDPYLGYIRNETVTTNYPYRNGHSLYYVVAEPYYNKQIYYNNYPQYNTYYSGPNNVIIHINKPKKVYYDKHKHYNYHYHRDYKHHDKRDNRHDNRHDKRDDRHDNRNNVRKEIKHEQPKQQEKRQWRQEAYQKKSEN